MVELIIRSRASVVSTLLRGIDLPNPENSLIIFHNGLHLKAALKTGGTVAATKDDGDRFFVGSKYGVAMGRVDKL